MTIALKGKMVLLTRALYFCMAEQWSEIGRNFKISPAQQHLLYLLAINPSLTPTQISELGCWHISTVTRLLKPLKEHGLVDVSHDPAQRKCKKVSMTEDGKELYNELVQSLPHYKHFPFPMDHLSETEIESFLDCGQKILDVIKGEDFYKKVILGKIEGV